MKRKAEISSISREDRVREMHTKCVSDDSYTLKWFIRTPSVNKVFLQTLHHQMIELETKLISQ